MQKKPHILITNDDGIFADGLKHLWLSLHDFADLSIIAPDLEKSGVGLCITLREPLQIQKVVWEKQTPAWKVNGTPADCVRMALSVILDNPPDLIVSGINKGSNSGRNVLYSGTVGGVIEGVMHNVPGIAFSCEEFERPNYQVVERHIVPIVRHYLENPLPKGTLLNVNFPKTEQIKGFKLARQGRGYWVESPDQRLHPEGHSYYWMGGKWRHCEEHEESDVALLEQGYMTAVPIHVDEMTDHAVLEKHRTPFEMLFRP